MLTNKSQSNYIINISFSINKIDLSDQEKCKPLRFWVLLAFITIASCSRVTLYSDEDGSNGHSIIATNPGNCSNISQSWPTKSIKISKNSADCIKIWELPNCSGHYRCFCHTNLKKLRDYGMNAETSWLHGGIRSVSECDHPEPIVASIDLYDHKGLKGENITINLHDNKCETFFYDDIWSTNVSSYQVTRGCVQYYLNERCVGKYGVAFRNESSTASQFSSTFVGDRWNDRIVSFKPCSSSDESLEETSITPLPVQASPTKVAPSPCNHSYEYIPVNCHSYYTCLNYTFKEFHECPEEDGLAFNPRLGVYDLIENVVECASIMDANPVPKHPISILELNNQNCENMSEYRPHLKDCRKYYFCNDSCRHDNENSTENDNYCEERICSEGLLWSVDIYGDGGSHQQCALPSKAICLATDATLAFTCRLKNDGYYRNDRDCRSFWRCVGGTAYLYNCPDGFVYDPENKNCLMAGRALEYCQ